MHLHSVWWQTKENAIIVIKVQPPDVNSPTWKRNITTSSASFSLGYTWKDFLSSCYPVGLLCYSWPLCWQRPTRPPWPPPDRRASLESRVFTLGSTGWLITYPLSGSPGATSASSTHPMSFIRLWRYTLICDWYKIALLQSCKTNVM